MIEKSWFNTMRGVAQFHFINITEGGVAQIDYVTVGSRTFTVDDFIERLLKDEYDANKFPWRDLEHVWPILEPIVIAKGGIAKLNKGGRAMYSGGRNKLKPNEYIPRILNYKCISIKFKNFEIIDANAWLNQRSFLNQPYNEKTLEFLESLCWKEKDYRATPAGQAWTQYNGYAFNYNTHELEEISKNHSINYNPCWTTKMKNKELWTVAQNAVQGGYITGIPGHYTKLYHYDFTSAYPSILAELDKLPDENNYCITTADEIADHDNYVYIVFNHTCHKYYWDIESKIIPAHSYKIGLTRYNFEYKLHMLILFLEKQKYTKGTPEYQCAKLFMNSFIGVMGSKKKTGKYVSQYMTKDEGHVYEDTSEDYPDVLTYGYVLALQRKRSKDIIKRAEKEGALCMQWNTDGGFFTKPLSFAIPKDNPRVKELGAFRFEYIGHNVDIFACNQYACDEEACIAGLPKELYRPGQRKYEFWVLNYNKKSHQVVYKKDKITLGAEE